MDGKVKDNNTKSRFELEVEGQTVFADYRISGEKIQILHVETPVPLRGHGAAGKLMQGIVDIIEKRHLKIIPICPYAIAWLNRHKEYQSLLD